MANPHRVLTLEKTGDNEVKVTSLVAIGAGENPFLTANHVATVTNMRVGKRVDLPLVATEEGGNELVAAENVAIEATALAVAGAGGPAEVIKLHEINS